MKKSGFIALMMSILMVVGCGTNAGTGSLLGGGGGAAVGALLGQLIGKNTKSTVIGAAIGTAVGTTAGALIGKHMDKVKARAAAIENASVTEITDQNGLSSARMLPPCFSQMPWAMDRPIPEPPVWRDRDLSTR